MTHLPTLLRRISATVLLSAWLLPTAASAADVAMKSRGSFIQDAVNTLNISPVHKGTLPYKRVPSIQKPYIQAAYDAGALGFLGDNLDPGRTITRGEALQIVVKLAHAVPNGSELAFSDVTKGSDLAQAITVAVEKEWLKPLRKGRFGVDQQMSSTEARLLLQRVKRTMSEPEKNPIRVKVNPSNAVQKEQSKMLDAVWDLLNKEYLYKDKLDSKKANYKATDALVKTLDDPYTVFFPPVESKQFQDQISGEVTGIGVQVEQNELGLLIVTPLHDSPAEKAGLKTGDIIISVDGNSIAGLSYVEAVNKIRGTKGTSVTVRVRRDGSELDFTLKRDTIKVPEIAVSMQGSIGIVKISQFGETTDKQIRAVFHELAEKNPTGVIIDLRNNPGGLLHAADVVMSAFIPDDSIVANIHTRTNLYQEVTSGKPIFDDDVDVAVLVNKGSASASEIVAGAFQDHKRATIVGETTFGKGTVQQIVEFKDGSSLKMTIAEWKTPLDRKIDGIGVVPDITVDSSSDADASLKRAIDLLY